MSNNFDTPVLLDEAPGTPAAPSDYFGFGRAAGGLVSTGPRIYSGAGNPNGVLTAPEGSVWLDTTGAGLFYTNTTGAAVWAVSNSAAAVTNVVADPGTGNPIPVNASGSIAITTAAAETNTLAIPTFEGQQLTMFVDTYAVGDRVITASQRINQATNTVMTFGAVGDAISLQAITIAGALRWQVMWNEGVALA